MVRVPKSGRKQGDAEYQDVSRQVEPGGQPSLNRDGHVSRSVLQVQTVLDISNSVTLRRRVSDTLDDQGRMSSTCSP